MDTANLESSNACKSMGRGRGRGRGRGQVKLGNFSSLLKAGELKKDADAMISVNIIVCRVYKQECLVMQRKTRE